MKIRNGFVSNSSSSSFIIRLDAISGAQLEMIKEHATIAKLLKEEFYDDDPWNIEVDGEFVRGDTFMDNFDMRHFFGLIGIPDNVVKWKGNNY